MRGKRRCEVHAPTRLAQRERAHRRRRETERGLRRCGESETSGGAEHDAPLTYRHVRTDSDEVRIVEEEFALGDGARVRAETSSLSALVARILVHSQHPSCIPGGDRGARVRAIATRNIVTHGRLRNDPLHGPSDD